MIRKILLLLSVFLPSFLKILVYTKIFKWEIGEDVKIGITYIDSKNVFLGSRVHIGHLNFIRNLRFLKIDSDTYIANLNSIFGVASYPEWPASLEIGNSVMIMSRHFFDVGGKISIGDGAVIGGRDTHIWSHSRIYDDYGTVTLEPLDVLIGQQTYIGARATLIGGAIPDRAVVGAGSVVTKRFPFEPTPVLIAGNPATIKKRYDFESEKQKQRILKSE